MGVGRLFVLVGDLKLSDSAGLGDRGNSAGVGVSAGRSPGIAVFGASRSPWCSLLGRRI